MAIQQGDKMPSGVFGIMTDSGPGAISTDELFAGKKVVLVAVPGAFTPTCSANHLPGFIEKADDLSAKGVDTVACMSVNDVFVMDAWGKDRKVGDKVVMVSMPQRWVSRWMPVDSAWEREASVSPLSLTTGWQRMSRLKRPGNSRSARPRRCWPACSLPGCERINPCLTAQWAARRFSCVPQFENRAFTSAGPFPAPARSRTGHLPGRCLRLRKLARPRPC